MAAFIIKPRLGLVTGILILPTLYFILISLLKYSFGHSYLFDQATPTLEHLGIKDSIGWNINLLILFGPALALLLNLLCVLHMQFKSDKENVNFSFSIKKNWWNLGIVALSSITLLVLFAYLVGENCHC